MSESEFDIFLLRGRQRNCEKGRGRRERKREKEKKLKKFERKSVTAYKIQRGRKNLK